LWASHRHSAAPATQSRRLLGPQWSRRESKHSRGCSTAMEPPTRLPACFSADYDQQPACHFRARQLPHLSFGLKGWCAALPASRVCKATSRLPELPVFLHVCARAGVDWTIPQDAEALGVDAGGPVATEFLWTRTGILGILTIVLHEWASILDRAMRKDV